MLIELDSEQALLVGGILYIQLNCLLVEEGVVQRALDSKSTGTSRAIVCVYSKWERIT